MKRIAGPDDLVNQYCNYLKEIDPFNNSKVAIVGGHFPLTHELVSVNKKASSLVEGNDKTLYENLDARGPFPTHTFELACRLVRKIADEQGKEVKIALLVDDINATGTTFSDFGIKHNSSTVRLLRKKFFEKHSTKELILPKELMNIVKDYGLSNDDFYRHTQIERGIENSVIFSQKKLESYSDLLVENLCAKALAGLCKHHISKNGPVHVLGMYPQRCENNVCENIYMEMQYFKGISSMTHVFFSGSRGMELEQMYSGKPVKLIKE